MIVNLKRQQIEYLKEHLKEDVPHLFEKLESSKIEGYAFDIDDDTAVLISDWAGNRLQRVGFDGDNEIVIERDMLDSIVDHLHW